MTSIQNNLVSDGDWKEDSEYFKVWAAWKGMNRRARERADCEVLFANYKAFKSYALSNGWFDGCLVCREGDLGNYEPNNIRFDTKQSNTEEALSKSYKFLNPKGEVVSCFNLSKFCRENNLHSGHMTGINNGLRKVHKGWRKYDKVYN